MNTQRIIFKWLAMVIVITMLSQFALVLPPASAAPLQTSAGTLTCLYDDPAVWDCVQIDPYTVRWNIIGNPYDQGNISGQFQVQYPNGLVYVTAHWDSPQWVSIYGWQTNPEGRFGIIGLPSVYVNDGGYGTPCGPNLSQLCGSYPVGTWNFTQDAVTNAFGRATIGVQQYANPSATVFWTPQNAYLIVSSVAYPPTPTPTPTYDCSGMTLSPIAQAVLAKVGTQESCSAY